MGLKEKLFNMQNELKAPKSQYNSFGKYKYRSCEDIMKAAKPLLAKYKCSLTMHDTVELIGDRFYVVATAVLSDSESDEEISTTAYAREPDMLKGQSESQITGSTSSYARKYCLNGLFLIDDTKDADVTNKGNDELSGIIDQIVTICTKVGGSKNKALMDVLKGFSANGNPKLIKSVDKAKECLAAVEKVEPIKE